MKICTCGSLVGRHGARGLCRPCYRAYRDEHPEEFPCKVEQCPGTVVALGLCGKHYQWKKKHGSLAPLASRACPLDGVVFSPANANQVWCSNRCATRASNEKRDAAARIVEVRVCWWCAAEFKTHDKRRQYCGEVCMDIGARLEGRMAAYGLSRDEYRSMYRRLGGLCEICRQPERTARNRLLAVDHDHETGHVKGLLCSHCNRALGLFGDSAETMRRAVEYVLRTRQLPLNLSVA